MTALFYSLIRLSLSASLVALAVMALRLLLKDRVPRALLCGLWVLVALRLLIPAFPESKISVVPQKVEDGTLIGQMSENAVEKTVTVNEADPAFTEIVELQKEAARPAQVKEEGGTQYVVVSEETQQAPKTFGETVVPVLAWIWAAGALLMLGYMAFSYGKVRRQVRQSVPEEENIWLCDGIRSSFILGLIRPRIYLPAGLKEARPYALAHEKSHLARGDQFWKPLGYLLLAVYWFNPVLWLSYILLCRDIEAACDERVIRERDGSFRKSYASALLQCSLPRGMAAACPLSFGGTDVKSRIKTVLKYRKPGVLAVAAAALLSLIAAGCALTDPAAAVPGMQTPAEQESAARPAGTEAEETQPLPANACDHSDCYRFAFFGVEGDGALLKEVQCEEIFLVSIRRETWDVQIVSVSPDFCVETADGLCRLADCYARYGAQETLDVLNRNLDLDLSEMICMNRKNRATAAGWLGAPEPGSGADEQQPATLLEKARSMSEVQFAAFVTTFLDVSYTNISREDITRWAAQVREMHLTGSAGFPFRARTAEFVFADGLAENVKELHGLLFNETDYAPSENVRRISQQQEN